MIQEPEREYIYAAGGQFVPVMTLAVGLVVGLFLGYQLNVEKTAQVMADKDCGVCQDNLNTMVGNFNIMAQQCKQTTPSYKDLPILIGNQTVRVYAS